MSEEKINAGSSKDNMEDTLNLHLEELDRMLEALSGDDGDVDQMLQEIKTELLDEPVEDSAEPEDTALEEPAAESEETFHDQEYLETFGTELDELFEAHEEQEEDASDSEFMDSDDMEAAGAFDPLEELADLPVEEDQLIPIDEAEALEVPAEPEEDAGADVPEKPDKEKKKKGKRKKRRGSFVFGTFGTLIYWVMVVAVALLLAKFLWLCADDMLALTKPDETVTVTLRSSDDLDDITDKLYDAGLIRYKWLFRLYGKYAHVENKVSAGVYELNNMYDYHALVNGMAGSTNRVTVSVTLVEGYDCKQIFELLEEKEVCTAAELEKAAANYDFDYEFLEGVEKGSANRLEGYLYPDTYEFYLDEDPETVLNRILVNFEHRMDDDIMAQVAASDYSLREILTIASIIEEEAASEEERPDVASVIYNRLNSDDLPYLQMDSTVFYAAALLGEEFDTDLDSPYNTYANAGLPAGPIDNPGMASIKAALNPSDTDYYYFAYGTDGVSHFYEDYDSFTEFVNSDEYAG